MEIEGLEQKIAGLEEAIRVLLIPKDPNDDRNVVLEIRAGTGGDEAALFASDLFRMYSRFAERSGWKVDVLSNSETGIGGLKEVIATDRGQERVPAAQARERRSPRPAGAVDGSERPHPHVHRHRRRAARSRGGRRPDRRQGPAGRHVLFERSRRPKRQHDLLGRARSRISPRASWSRSRTKSRRSRTGRRP